MNKNSSNIIKEVLLAFAMGIIFLAGILTPYYGVSIKCIT